MNQWYTLILAAALAILPMATSLAGEGVSATQPTKEIKEDGFEIPKKGPLISELREKMGDEPPGVQTVVRIYEDAAGNRVKDSSVNGAVFRIEVTPFHGFTYVLMDTNGDGLFETKFHGHEPQFVIPQWVIFRF